MRRLFQQAAYRVSIAICVLIAMGAETRAIADGLDDVTDGNTAFKRGHYERAVESFTRAIISGDLNIEAMAITLNNRGVAYGELGDYDRAMRDYDDALTLRPEDPTTLKNMRVALVRRGFAHLNLGANQEARDDYNEAIKIAPDHHLAYLRRGELELQEKNYTAAIADLERADELKPGERVVSDLLIEAQRQREEAASLAQRDLGLGSTNDVTTARADDETSSSDAELTDVEPAASPIASEALAPVADNLGPPENDGAEEIDAAPGVEATEELPQETASIEQADNPPPPELEPAGDTVARVRAINPVNYRAGPGNDFERLGSVAEGDVMAYFRIERGWYEIEAANGDRGFIYRRWLEDVE